jgi:hypothetical protein
MLVDSRWYEVLMWMEGSSFIIVFTGIYIRREAHTKSVGGRHHKKKWWPQKKVVATKKSGGHKKKWWPQKKVVATKKSGGHKKSGAASRRKEFSVRKRKQVLSCGEPYFLNGRCQYVDTYMYVYGYVKYPSRNRQIRVTSASCRLPATHRPTALHVCLSRQIQSEKNSNLLLKLLPLLLPRHTSLVVPIGIGRPYASSSAPSAWGKKYQDAHSRGRLVVGRRIPSIRIEGECISAFQPSASAIVFIDISG